MPVQPARKNFEWVRGSTSPFQVTIKINDVAQEFDDVRLTVNAQGGTLAFRLSKTDTPDQVLVDAGTKQISFVPTAAQTRLLTRSKLDLPGKNTYEVETRLGDAEEVYLMGVIAGIGGDNDDEEVS